MGTTDLPLFEVAARVENHPGADGVLDGSCDGVPPGLPGGFAFTVFHMRMQLFLWSHFYYIMDDPLTEDRLYDINYNDLVAIEKSHPELAAAHSPTKCVGCGCPTCKPGAFSVVEHEYWLPMINGRVMHPASTRKKGVA